MPATREASTRLALVGILRVQPGSELVVLPYQARAKSKSGPCMLARSPGDDVPFREAVKKCGRVFMAKSRVECRRPPRLALTGQRWASLSVERRDGKHRIAA